MRRLSYLLFLFAFFPAGNLAAQNMRAHNDMLSRQNIAMDMLMNARWIGAWGNNNTYNPKHTFLVTMADGSKKEVYSRIYADTVMHKSYLVFEDKSLPRSAANRITKIYPEQTTDITRNLALAPSTVKRADFPTPPKYYTGIAKDSCWMFKVIAGPISAYSLLSEEEGQMFNPETIVGIQLSNGPIVKVTKEHLEEMITGDDDAIKALLDKNYLKAIRVYNRHYLKAKKTAAAGTN